MFLCFRYLIDNPEGGINDFCGIFATLEEAKKHTGIYRYFTGHIVEINNRGLVAEWELHRINPLPDEHSNSPIPPEPTYEWHEIDDYWPVYIKQKKVDAHA